MSTPTRPSRGATDLDIVQAALERDYEVLQELGRGGMATVYRARDRMLDREVAIKVLPFTLAFDESFVERFMREARTSARLEHPHIIPIHRVGQSGQVTYFVMKLLRGQSLSDRLLAHGPLGAEETRRVLTETASALGYAHRNGVVHRDIKPDNILLDEAGRSVVTDFGIARSGSDSKLTATGTSVGTPRYMSPEQARARDVDGRSDIYSLGVVGYECLTGRTPFDGDDPFAILMDHINAPLPEPALKSADARSLYVIIERMLAKRAEDRFTDAEELVAALKGEIAVRPVSAYAAPAAFEDASSSTSPLYGTPSSGPSSAPALDRALEAGFDMLKQQRPKVDAGLEAGKRAIALHAPKVRSAVGQVGERVGEQIARIPGRIAPLRDRLAPIRVYALANQRRFMSMVAGVALALVGLYYSAHFALYHRSRCPSGAAATPNPAGDSNVASAARTRPFSLMVDDAGAIRRGGDAEVYYDVCGLEKGAGFTTRVTITRSESGLNRLFGRSAGSVTGKYEESAGGPATRRHRSLDMDGMPGGAYWVNVVVTDDKGRRREEGTSLRVRGGE
jgi:serine/threonine protein kinase